MTDWRNGLGLAPDKDTSGFAAGVWAAGKAPYMNGAANPLQGSTPDFPSLGIEPLNTEATKSKSIAENLADKSKEELIIILNGQLKDREADGSIEHTMEIGRNR